MARSWSPDNEDLPLCITNQYLLTPGDSVLIEASRRRPVCFVSPRDALGTTIDLEGCCAGGGVISGSGYGTYVQQSWLLDSPAPVRVSTTGSCTLRALPGIDSLTGFRVGWGKLSAELKLGVIQYCVCLPQAVPSSDCRESPSAHDRQLSAYKGLLLPLLHSGVAELATLGREVFYSHNTFAFDLDPSTECRDYQGRHRPPDFYVNAPPLSARSLLRRIEVHMSMTAVDFAKLRRLNAVLFNDCLHPSARVDVYIHFIVSDYHCSKRIPYRCMDDSIEYSVLGLTSKVGLDYCSTMLLNSLELEFEQVLKRLDSDPIRIPLQGSVQVVGQAYTTLNMRPSASAFTPSRNGRPVDARDTAITYPTCLRNRHGQDVLSPESYALWKAKFEALVELTPHVAPASSPSTIPNLPSRRASEDATQANSGTIRDVSAASPTLTSDVCGRHRRDDCMSIRLTQPFIIPVVGRLESKATYATPLQIGAALRGLADELDGTPCFVHTMTGGLCDEHGDTTFSSSGRLNLAMVICSSAPVRVSGGYGPLLVSPLFGTMAAFARGWAKLADCERRRLQNHRGVTGGPPGSSARSSTLQELIVRYMVCARSVGAPRNPDDNHIQHGDVCLGDGDPLTLSHSEFFRENVLDLLCVGCGVEQDVCDIAAGQGHAAAAAEFAHLARTTYYSCNTFATDDYLVDGRRTRVLSPPPIIRPFVRRLVHTIDLREESLLGVINLAKDFSALAYLTLRVKWWVCDYHDRLRSECFEALDEDLYDTGDGVFGVPPQASVRGCEMRIRGVLYDMLGIWRAEGGQVQKTRLSCAGHIDFVDDLYLRCDSSGVFNQTQAVEIRDQFEADLRDKFQFQTVV